MNHLALMAFRGRAFSRRASGAKLARRTILVSAALGALFFLASCAKQGSGQHATVLMRDGSELTGTVAATSPSEITLAGDDKTTHTIPMSQVKSIEYDEAAPQGAATSADNSGGGAAPSGDARATKASSDRVHEHHYHPTQAQIHTKTYVVPDGDRKSVV